MSVADQSVPLANVAGRVPFTVRFSPQFVNRMFDRLQKSAPSRANVAGLLFGHIAQDVSEVQVFRSVPDADGKPNLAAPPEQLTETIEHLIAASRQDPEVSALTLLGWYSCRATGGLHENDVAFHNRFFRQPGEVALILRPDQHPNVLFEIYSKAGTTLLSEDEHRWGSLRLSTDSNVLGPIDVAMRAKIGDDFYLRAYQVSKTLDRAERREHWASTVEATKSTVRSLFRPKRRESYSLNGAPLHTEDPPIAHQETRTPEARTPAPPLARAAAAAAAPLTFNRPALQHSPASAESSLAPSFRRQVKEQAPAPVRNPAALEKIVAGDPPGLPAVINPPKRGGGVPWISSVVVFAIAAGATFALYVEGVGNSSETPRFLRAIFPDTGLGLRVEGQGDRVLLSWNRRNALVRSSQGGVLHIDDGPQHRDVRLDPAQIANGSVLYRPGSDDVSFRLEIRGAQGAGIAETTRVLDGAKATPLEAKNITPDLSAPSSTTAETPLPANTSQSGRDQRTRHSDAVIPPALRSLDTPAPSPTDINKPASVNKTSVPESHSLPARDTTQQASAPAPATPTPARTDSATANTTATPTTSKPAQTTTPASTESRSANTPPQIPVETSRPSVPASSPEPIRQPDTSKVSNWEDIPSPAAKPAESNQARPSSLPATQPTFTGPAAEAKPAATFVPPRPLKQVLPDLRSIAPGSIGSMSQLEVAVRVNKKGHVSEAYLVGDASKVAPHLARAALNAAKQWTFQPATIRGKSVPSDHTIVFEFRPSGH